ncbi:hypothetical+protein [Methylocapsa aurea]|uniref:YARHG domain-containing protein n=1 Tax=Methylocapsa aurea TaxID=663610 RepID=UPI003D18B8A6
MKSMSDMIRILAAGAILSAFAEIAAPAPALAQSGALSCDRLWRERNAIYARAGHCFKTTRGRSVFGGGCFPPYGQLGGADARRVRQLQTLERQNGC